MRNFFLLVFGVIFVCIGCSSSKDIADCSDSICTEEHVSIPITIVYEDGSTVILDGYEVRELSTGNVRNVPNIGEGSHTYIIASDLDRKDFYNKKVGLQLIGKIAGKIVMKEDYILTADCCHVSLLEGNKTVTIKR